MMMHEGLEELSHFIAGDFNPCHCNSALGGQESNQIRGVWAKLGNGIGPSTVCTSTINTLLVTLTPSQTLGLFSFSELPY